MKKPSMSKCINQQQYNNHRIAYELEATASGDAYYGNSLRVAKDIPGLTPDDIALLDRWLRGADDKSGADFHDLHGLAIKIRMGG